ncbi:MAG: lipopolysaccharide heptosyltransferase II [Lentisphaerae bacterium RIFOXYB12_FULL_65_16]|nr:MAG: lipopolysaccharide heptosyltransferase II [Lentisphaerae bacterium RIFOXYA12_64_32]OGV87132.1 MAG: lipopolysaccharide heptosyltransferase II [Lentisphaerae bacterium RIFOXYB12_FULL_65_16]
MKPSPKTILVRCPNWVGDLVMATPVFACLRSNFPEARIVACMRRHLRGILEDSPWIDEFIYGDDKSVRGFFTLVRQVRQARPELTLVMTNSSWTFLPLWLAGASPAYGYRHRFPRRYLITGGPEPRRDDNGVRRVPMLDYYLELCRFLNLKLDENPRPVLFAAPELQKAGDEYLARHGVRPEDRVIGLNPGARFGSSKCWPPEHFARLADLLQANLPCKILLLVGPREEEIARRIREASHTELVDTASDPVDLALLKPLIRRCSLLVTNDTGPRHYAVAFNVPVVVIMGPTDPRYTGANLEKTAILRRNIDCSPCHLKVCPQDHRCMTEITPEMVLAEAIRLLECNCPHEAGNVPQTLEPPAPGADRAGRA